MQFCFEYEIGKEKLGKIAPFEINQFFKFSYKIKVSFGKLNSEFSKSEIC
jgi:hypothetical protein